MSIKAYVSLAIGIFLLVVGIDMKYAEKKWDEVVVQTEEQSTKRENATIGAVAGAVVGGSAAATVGGIGIVVAGTGVGLPAGAALIALAAVIGGITGGVVGAAAGESNTHTVENIVTHIEPAYETWQWALVMVFAAIFLLIAVVDFRSKLLAEKKSK